MATNGPFSAGYWLDISIFRDRTMGILDYDERVEADNGYQGEPTHIDLPSDCLGLGGIHERWEKRRRKESVRARHETVNRLFKEFNYLNQVYRYELDRHSSIFRAVVVLTQIGIDHVEFW